MAVEKSFDTLLFVEMRLSHGFRFLIDSKLYVSGYFLSRYTMDAVVPNGFQVYFGYYYIRLSHICFYRFFGAKLNYN